jgi:small subunit ribosomal protein S25e
MVPRPLHNLPCPANCPKGSSDSRQEAKEKVVQGEGFVKPFGILHKAILTYFFPTVKDKANHAVILDKSTADKLQKDVQSYRLITVAVLVDRLKINGSLARAAMKDLEEKGLIKKVVGHSRMQIYSKLHFFTDKCRIGRIGV